MMQKTLQAAMLALTLSGPAWAAVDVDVGVTIREPGMYGRIEIGSQPPPAVIYRQPVVIVPAPVAVVRRPIYLYVPPGHARNWKKHCGYYSACGQPVYFVREDWVRDHRHDWDGDERHHRGGHRGKHDD